MTTRQDRMRELRTELRRLEDEDDAPPLTVADVRKLTPAQINARWDEVSAVLKGTKPVEPESGPAA